MEKSFKELALDPVGTIYHEEMKDGIRFLVLRGPSHLCAYLGIPKTHPLAGFNYDDLPIDCHGGLTYSGDKLRGICEKYQDLYFYGWDYGHCGDVSFYDLESSGLWLDSQAWVVKAVVQDSWSAQNDMRHLMKLAEEIYSRAKKEEE